MESQEQSPIIPNQTPNPIPIPKPNQNNNQLLYITLMSKRRTWVTLYTTLYTIFLYFSWNLLCSILDNGGGGWAAAAALGAVFGMISMAAALAVAVPAMLVTWITVVVLLTLSGKGRRELVVQGKKLSGEIVGVVIRILIKEGNFVAGVCAVLSYFLIIRRNDNGDDGEF